MEEKSEVTCEDGPACSGSVERTGKATSTVKSEITEQTRREVKTFAAQILKVLKSYVTQQDKDYEEWLGVKAEDRVTVSVEYPLYQQSQACYAVNTLIDKTAKVHKRTSYCGGERSAADYQDVEIKREVYQSLLVSGKIFFTWKKMKCIASVFFSGNYSEASFVHAKKHAKTSKKFQAELREFMCKHNYFKGEKLEFMPYSRIKFLSFPDLDWNSLILKKELKDEIALNLIFPLHNQKLCDKFNVPWRRGVLLAGVPGTGKTQLGRVLCNKLDGITVIWATCKSVQDVSRVRNLFEIARNFAPTLIVMEDLDFYGQDREFTTNPIVGELLNQLDGNAPNVGVFVLATTNRPYLLDKALADRPSRFDIKLVFGLPDVNERRAMINLFGKKKNIKPSVDYIARMSDKLTGAHIKEVINYAQLVSLNDGREEIQTKDIDLALRKVKTKLEAQRKNNLVR